MPTTIPPTERLLDLVIALVNTSNRMTKAQIRRSVAGYDAAPSVEAFERMFERDKDALRELGIPIETVTDAAHGDDVGYRVDLDAYALSPIELTPAQNGVLGLAARFWQDPSPAGLVRRNPSPSWHREQGPAVTPSCRSWMRFSTPRPSPSDTAPRTPVRSGSGRSNRGGWWPVEGACLLYTSPSP